MAVLKIMKYGSDVLRTVAQPVEEITDEIKQIAQDMIETMYSSGGVGLAAPQVGIPRRIIVMDPDPNDPSIRAVVLINPEIVEREGELSIEEGCLSVPDVRGDVKRSQKVVVEALNLDGTKVRIEATDIHARILQHEIDHLNGKIFVEHLGRLKQQLIKKHLEKIARDSVNNQ